MTTFDAAIVMLVFEKLELKRELEKIQDDLNKFRSYFFYKSHDCPKCEALMELGTDSQNSDCWICSECRQSYHWSGLMYRYLNDAKKIHTEQEK